MKTYELMSESELLGALGDSILRDQAGIWYRVFGVYGTRTKTLAIWLVTRRIERKWTECLEALVL
jgi:hypothetical protein